jgi:hypothetical protein
LRRTLLAPGQLYGSPGGEYQDSYRMLRRVTLTKLYRRAVSTNTFYTPMRLSVVIIFLLISVSCRNSTNTKNLNSNNLDNFSFEISTNFMEYNSNNCKYSVKYSTKDSSVFACLSPQEKDTLIKSFLKFDFMSLPEKISGSVITLPQPYISLQITYNDITKKVISECDEQSINSIRFDSLCKTIWDILENKTQIKNMPISDIVLF